MCGWGGWLGWLGEWEEKWGLKLTSAKLEVEVTAELDNTRTFHKKDAEISCNICGYQVSQKKNLTRHKVIKHEVVKHPCSQCNHKATTKQNLAKHKKAEHEGVKHPCG